MHTLIHRPPDWLQRVIAGSLFLAAWGGAALPRLQANPAGGTVAQGTATFSSSGAHLTIQTSDRAFINWKSFNIGVGETTTFVQPSASSLVWNSIHDANPSQILGNLNANGYVILQNQNGFYIGGQALINAHGLVLTTSPIPMPDLAGSSAWQFNNPPPAARIVNYGNINVDSGGAAYLIAYNIENHGTITAPQGDVGLHAADSVLISERPDGRGLSAQVTLPAGSVDNTGKVIADAGTIAMHAQVVNQGGLLQANSVREVNGVIELVASDAINLGAHSTLSARGDTAGISAGGSVIVKSAGTFSDQVGSSINIAGGTAGGDAGAVELSAANLSAPQSQIEAHAASGYRGGRLLLDPTDLTLDSAYVSTLNSQISGGLSQIDLQADHNITVSAAWSLANQTAAASLSLTAGNSIILNNNSYIKAGNNWSLSLTAGPLDLAVKPITARTAGIYLDGSAYLQTANGDITAWAANELLINANTVTAGVNGIRTLGGGNISVTAKLGNVNTGGNNQGYQFKVLAPYYSVSSTVGGISTAGGGDVNITAGGDVTSFLPKTSSGSGDAGTGAFGANPGNVTITAGGSVYGHYVVANGRGTITAGQDVGNSSGDVALSLIKGSWNLVAQSGSISLQEVRDPNAVFNDFSGGSNLGRHYVDYDSLASVSLQAENGGVALTGANIPRPNGGVSIIYPPSLEIAAGSGGVLLNKTISLFPSDNQNLKIVTTAGGDLVAPQADPTVPPTELIMSDSDSTRWLGSTSFGSDDHGAKVYGLNNPDPVILNIDGDIKNLILQVTKQAQIDIGGDLINSSFSGQNLHASDVTSIKVGGQIFNRSPYSFTYLDTGIGNVPIQDLPINAGSSWETIFTVALNADAVANLVIPSGLQPSQWAAYVAQQASLFPGGNPGFVYNASTRRLGFAGDMSSVLSAQQLAVLQGGAGFTVLRYDPTTGLPAVYTGADGKQHFQTDTVSWAAPTKVAELYTASLGAPTAKDSTQFGYRVGGPGTFNVEAGSISLGNSLGILSSGVGQPPGGHALYSKLAPYTDSGANLNVVVHGNLDMLSSTIAVLGGGNLSVSVDGTIDLGSPELSGARSDPGSLAFGIFNTSPLLKDDAGNHISGDVNVIAGGDIDINGSRIAAYNGGAVAIKSLTGNVDAGAGGAVQANIYYYFVDPLTGLVGRLLGGVYGSGILATTLPLAAGAIAPPSAATQPGDITVLTPQGSIFASQGGILQEALNGNVAPGPTVTLKAGTDPSEGNPGYQGDIDLGNGGVIGGTVNVSANGDVKGLVISRQDSSVQAAQNFSGTVISGGSANLSAGGSIVGTVFGVGGVKASGDVSGATLLGQNVSANGGQSQSTLGTTATASAAASAASAQAGTDAKEQVAGNNGTSDDDDKKKKKKQPLLQRVGRVTVILPKA